MQLKRIRFLCMLVLVVFTTSTFANNLKEYDAIAKSTYSHNDVSAFVFKWFAMFDHQEHITQFKKHVPKENVVMNFPDFPIRTMADFEKWYQGVIDNIQYNTHHIRDLKVVGNEKEGFDVSFIVNWKARTYDKEYYDVDVHQEWQVKVNENREFIISNHVAKVVK